MSVNHVESIARTDKLYCTTCNRKIKKGERVVFELDDCEKRLMQNVYCNNCSDMYKEEVFNSDVHCFDLEE